MKKIWICIKHYVEEYAPLWFCILGIIFALVGIYREFTEIRKIESSTSCPVEEIRIDSLSKENNTLILEVDSLNTIKDAQIIEVKTLDNDSTLRLFYQLIRKR